MTSMEQMSEEDKWSKQIKDTLGLTKSKLMFDFSTCCEKQKHLMGNILFKDSTSIAYWLDYVKCVAEKHDNYNSINRLLNIIFQMIDTVEDSSDEDIINLYLFKATYLRSHQRDQRKVFHDMERKNIGRNSRALYEKWAECEMEYNPQRAMELRERAAACSPTVISDPRRKMARSFDDGEVGSTGTVGTVGDRSEEDGEGEDSAVTVTATVTLQPAGRSELGQVDSDDEQDTVQLPLQDAQGSAVSTEVPVQSRPVVAPRVEPQPSTRARLGKALRVPPSRTLKDDDGESVVVFNAKSIGKSTVPKSSDGISNQSDEDTTVTNSSTADVDTTAIQPTALADSQPAPQESACSLKSKYIDERLQNFDKYLLGPAASAAKRSKNSSGQTHQSSYSRPLSIEDFIPQKKKLEEVAPLTSSSSDCDTVQQQEGSAVDTTAPDEAGGNKCKADKDLGGSEKQKKDRRVSFAKGKDDSSEDLHAKENVARKRKLAKRRSGESCDNDLSISLKPVKRSCGARDSSRLSSNSCGGKAAASMCKDISVSGEAYLQLDGVIGRGASSSVCRVMHMPSANIYAFKRVDVRNSSADDADEVLESYANEINLLNQCKGSLYIIDLIDYEINRDQMFVAMVMEMGEIDLATSIVNQKKAYAADHPGSSKVNPFFMRMVWERMLLAVDYLHQQRIVHGDLKPANFVFVKGQLKLIDFGISREISGDTTNIVRTGIIGTVNYMAPEAVMPSTSCRDVDNSLEEGDSPSAVRDHTIIKHGRASDIWSLGCILYQMLYGKTPFSSCRNPHQKIIMIANPKADIAFEPIDEELGIEVAKMCLVRDVAKRATIRGTKGLLAHEFLTSHNSRKDRADVSTDCNGLDARPPTSSQSGVASPQVGPQKVTLCQVREIVQLALNHSSEVLSGRMGKEILCQQAMTSLGAGKENAEGKGKDRKAPLRPFESRLPLQRLPQNLKDQIQCQSGSPSKDNEVVCVNGKSTAKPKLQQVLRSNSSKWMRPRGNTPEKRDMKSLLERQLGTMRKFLEHETDDTVGSAFDLQDEFSFQNF